MPTTDTLTYDQTPPRLPVLDDLNGGTITNDTEFTPNVGDPNALGMNQSDRQIVALANVAPAMHIEVHFASGTPSIYGLWGLPTTMSAGSFTVVDNGAGDTSVTHTGGLLPGLRWSATADQVDDTEIDRLRVVPITNGWRVKSKLGTVGTDCNFVLHVSGL